MQQCCINCDESSDLTELADYGQIEVQRGGRIFDCHLAANAPLGDDELSCGLQRKESSVS